ncbi:MAG: hypothetical protein GQ527_11310 [Bacteroidales bacterium]|nr:hypothetical protein [Bacteroidales bacterium]
MKKIKIIPTTIDLHPERIILLSGAGQNVGKTTFACQLIEHLKASSQKVFAIKISPHFHDADPPKTIFSSERFVLSLESEKETGKDTSRMLAAGADEVFFLQVNDEFLEEAFQYTMSFVPPEVLVVIESGGLGELIKPALFFFVKRAGISEMKEVAAKNRKLADRVIQFDGEAFDFQVENVLYKNGQIKLND